ncbi:retrotransposon protein, putative, ty1-copia subclass [Tanacetum coccineum]
MVEDYHAKKVIMRGGLEIAIRERFKGLISVESVFTSSPLSVYLYDYHSRNNSVFRAFFEKRRLTGPNFIDWYRNLQIVLSVENKLPFLEQPIPAMPVPPAGQVLHPDVLATHSTGVKASKEIAGLMLMTMDLDIQKNLEQLGTYDMLKELKTFYIDNLERLGHAMTQNLAVSLILVSLINEYDNFMQNYNMHGMGKTVTELHAMLKLHGQTLPKKDVAPALHAIRAGKFDVEVLLGFMIRVVTDEAVGSYHLCLPSGLVLVLHNCHYAPSITRGSISVSNLYDDGFINCFDENNTISVSRNNVVYFSAIPRNGIYETDLSNSYTNDCSMYAVSNKRAKINLDPTLLWHCRLGHISKKRIEKLQHDRLLNSTNNQSFDKCVSCMSGKMARKPYTHQVERAKDLLGLIHTDVCGPFRTVSKQGASYFVTFTDDFSRYSYVYLLKHKDEVFETFKVFQNEVENQLGKTIKLLRSDRGCEYMIGGHNEPTNYKAALLVPESEKWLDARNVEMQSMKDKEVWDLVDFPPDGKTVGSKWLFKKKTDMDGAVHTYKARLVTKGFTRTYGVDYEETFSPVADIRAIRILIAIVAFYDYDIWQMDVKTAFLS